MHRDGRLESFGRFSPYSPTSVFSFDSKDNAREERQVHEPEFATTYAPERGGYYPPGC